MPYVECARDVLVPHCAEMKRVPLVVVEQFRTGTIKMFGTGAAGLVR
jgi:hypothetical protein